MSATVSVAQYLITRLQQLGLKHLFAVPGDYCSPFLDALDSTEGMERIPNINELGSGYAADGYARFTGIGAACVQYGVGNFPILNCTAGSYVERVPVAVISSSPNAKSRRLERTQGILFHHSTGNLQADKLVFDNVTVASEIVEDVNSAPAQIDGALTKMITHRRPVYIEVINNVWTLNCPAPEGELKPVVTPSDPKSLAAAVESAWQRIKKAKLPVLWLGVEIQRYGLQDVMQQIIDASGMFFTTTSLGKTVLDESQAAFAGTYAGPASPAFTNALMTKSDCPIALGTIITDDYLNIMASSFGKMVEVNDERTRNGYEYFHQVTLPDFLHGLLAKFTEDSSYPRQFERPDAPPDPEPPSCKPDELLSYNNFYFELANYWKDDTVHNNNVLVLGESTQLYVFGNLFGLAQNGFVGQAAWGSLGHETGCALGIALGTGKRPFVVAGDGGFMMICQELSSLARQKCNAVVFVMSNQAYAIEQAFVNLAAFQQGGEFAPFDLLPTWDYLALAQAFHVKGFRVKTIEELRGVLEEVTALQDVPALVEVIIPQKDLAPQLKALAETPAPKYHTLRSALRHEGN